MTNDNQIKNDDNYTHIDEFDEKLLDHDYDGIRELDNPAPAWIMAIFYITIFIAVAYGAYYFWIGNGPNQIEEYAQENADHIKKYGSQESNEVLALVTDEKSLAEGKDIYMKNCVACHGVNGEGGIGANLTDANWIHGCKFDNVFEVIKEGAPNGMISYKSQMGDKKIQKVASYILTELSGKNAAGKTAEGETCK